MSADFLVQKLEYCILPSIYLSRLACLSCGQFSNLLFIENSTSVSFLSLKNWRLVKLKEFCELIVGNYSKCFIGELNFHEIKNLKILLSIIQWIVFLAWLQFNQWGMQNCSLFLWRAHHFLLEIAKATCAP